MPHWPHGDPDALARAILAQPAYRESIAASTDRKPDLTLLETIWQWFVDHVLHPIFGPLSHALGASKGFGTIVGYVLIAAALAGLIFVIVRLVLAFVPRLRRRDGATGDARSLEELRSHDDWLALARAAAGRGDYRRAIGALFSAALAVLDDRALVAFDPARTPGEYRRLVRRARDEASAPFDALADRFVRATYAEAAPERADFDAAERAFAAFDPVVRA